MTLLNAKTTLGRSSQAVEAVFWPEFSFLGDYIPLLISQRWITHLKESVYLLTILLVVCYVIPVS